MNILLLTVAALSLADSEFRRCAAEVCPASDVRTSLSLTVEPGGMSVEAALESIRAARTAGDTSTVTVVVRGENFLEKTLRFDERDHDIVFAGEGDAALSGGIRVNGWRDRGDGVWEAPAVRTQNGEVAFADQLWVNGRRAPCARLPDEGWLTFAATSQTVARVEKGVTNYVDHVVFTDRNVLEKLAGVPREDYAHLEVGVICKWAYGLRTLTSFDAASGTIGLETPFRSEKWKFWRTNDTLVAFSNVRTAFDAPGEWFLDMTDKMIRYRPRPGERVPDLKIVIPRPGLHKLLTFQGDFRNGRRIRNIAFRNVTLEYAGAETVDNRPRQLNQHQAASVMHGSIELEGVENVRFDNCRIRHTAGHGLRFGSACVSNQVVNCRLTDIGSGGIWMGADMDRRAVRSVGRRIVLPTRPDSTAFNVISNCVLTGGGRYDPEGTGIALTHCSDTRVVCNDVSDFFYSGISVGYVWGYGGSVAQRNEIAFNRVWNLGQAVMSDMAGIYLLGTSFGTVVHDNLVHDISAYTYGGMGLYCDEGTEGALLERNVVWNTQDGNFYMHYGSGVIVRNNIFAWNREYASIRFLRGEKHGIPSSLDFVNNIILSDGCPLVSPHARSVCGVWANNVWFDVRGEGKAVFDGLSWRDWKRLRHETGSVFQDPGFKDARNLDFTLEADSPAVTRGFQPFGDALGLPPSSADVRIFRGDARHAYRDPAVVWQDGCFYLFFTLVETENDGSVFSYLAESESRDLVHWSAPRKLTVRDNAKDYSSPGNIVRDGDRWVLCLQTYPRPGNRNDGKVRYASEEARLFTMSSRDLRVWSSPELLRVKGPDVQEKAMGRMIDPYLLKLPEGGWMCFYKQNGVSFSRSEDLKTWTPVGRAEAGENVCVVRDGSRYVMVHSPENGLGFKVSTDLLHWRDLPERVTLGQKKWPWARGRLTAGFLLDARAIKGVGAWLLFFHGSGPRKESEGDFDRNASLAVVRAPTVESLLNDDVVDSSQP